METVNEMVSYFRLSEYLRPGMALAMILVLLFFVVMTVVLNYHWNKYVLDKSKLRKARLLYFGIAGILIIISLISLILIVGPQYF